MSSARDIGIVGVSRSGSTVVGLTLGRHPDVTMVGERDRLNRIWLRGGTCGCGVSMQDCAYWQAIDARIDFASGDLRRPDEALAFYDVVRGITGARIIVDSSKVPEAFASLTEPMLLQLVRDPRGHALSRHRGFRGTNIGHPSLRDLAYISLHWQRRNLQVARLRRRNGGLVAHYETFVAEPEAVAQRILEAAGVQGPLRPLYQQHVVAGNPRAKRGGKPITTDDEWQRRLPRAHRILGWASALPGAAWYGYRP